MRRTYYRIYIHIIWTTKNREKMIIQCIEDSIYKIIRDKCRKFKVEEIAIGNTNDHIHLLLSINPNIKISELVAEIKGSTSHYINNNTNQNLYWQDGYGVISVSEPALNKVKQYVLNQKEHHAIGSIQLELEKSEDA